MGKFCRGIVLLALFAAGSFAQESSSAPAAATSVATTGASGALSQALSAACSQSQTDFAKFLTARNKEAFARMTPAARVALMKRFVLLSQPGKPSTTLNASGRPTVRCDTPDGAAEIQIGGADQTDSLAFLPVELRDATDLAGSDVVRVNMGMVREDNQWRLLSLGLVLLDLPSLELEWNSAEISANESAALETMKAVVQAIETYRRTYTRLPESLAKLGPPPASPTGKTKAKPTPDAADLLDAELAGGSKDGYAYRYVVVGASTLGAVAQYELAASPVPYGSAGRRSFLRDTAGTIHAADHKGAVGSATDPKIE
ncbi:MAG TPA: hypothetical protein VKF79_05540 [Candidatus Acidoferrum sp.]|nr:hypothetical protein [Candidatus Acidoferrum sp.]